MSFHKSLLPGSAFPELTIKTTSGSTIVTKNSPDSDATLIVVYRGAFCPFFQGTILNLKEKYSTLKDKKVDLIAISVDKLDVAQAHLASIGGVPYTVGYGYGYGLEPKDLKALGVYVSQPTGYVPQTHVFAEPAWFLLDKESKIKYLSIGSFPAASRPDVDNILAAYGYAIDRALTDIPFRKAFWGNVDTETL